jgi:hypothetical protein
MCGIKTKSNKQTKKQETISSSFLTGFCLLYCTCYLLSVLCIFMSVLRSLCALLLVSHLCVFVVTLCVFVVMCN